ncbi:hypothetical protein QAD02_018172, partial [Eretmocerus hayati]
MDFIRNFPSPQDPKAFEDFYCRCPKFIFKVFGLWPSQSPLRKHITFIIGVLYTLSVVVPEAIFIPQCGLQDFDIIVENLAAISLVLLGFGEYCVLYYNHSKFKELYAESLENWEDIEDRKERKILTKCVRIASLTGFIYAVFVMGGVILVPPCLPLTSVLMDHFYPMENDSHKFPPFYVDYVFFNQDNIYWISWLHMWLYYVLNILMNTGFVCIYILYVNEICGLSDILSFRLFTAHTSNVRAYGEILRNYSYNFEPFDLKKFVYLHNKSFRFCEMLEDNFNIIFLSVVMNSVLPISLLYYYVAYSSAPVLKRVGGAGIWMGLNAFLCLFHWIGQAIIDHSNRTFNSAYSSDWPGMSVKDRKILLLIMMRCSKPYVLTTGKILPLSMESFGK